MGEYNHYYGSESPFINLFDIIHDQQMEHYLAPCILHFLSRNSVQGPSRGFSRICDITAYLSGIGFSLKASDEVLRRLEGKQLIEPAIAIGERNYGQKRLRITTLGSFHLYYLCHVFQYLDAMTLDTPICDSKTRKHMLDTMKIHERINRTKIFLDYLDGALNDLKDNVFVKFWKEHISKAHKEIKEIEQRN